MTPDDLPDDLPDVLPDVLPDGLPDDLPDRRAAPVITQVADALLVDYYDSMYAYQAKTREGSEQHLVVCESGDALSNARRLLIEYERLNLS